MNECKKCKYRSLIHPEECEYYNIHLTCNEMRRGRINCYYFTESYTTRIINFLNRLFK